jgi:prepilin-type N-terminal cleavage/methylation domain-containing protein
MQLRIRGRSGYSMIELLVVLFIIGTLAVVGVTMLRYRTEDSLRTVMDELEGTLASAHKFAVATGQDVLIATSGEWSATNPLVLSYGGAGTAASPTTSSTILTNGATSSQTFRVGVVGSSLIQEHRHAEVVTGDHAGDWATALNGGKDITSVPPFNDATTGFQGIMTAPAVANAAWVGNLFQGNATTSVRISGSNLRFANTFWIEVVGTRGGAPVPGGPMGLLVVLANGATIFKFYNPGTLSGSNGTWRRI